MEKESWRWTCGTYTRQEALDYLANDGLKEEDHEIIQTQSHLLLVKTLRQES